MAKLKEGVEVAPYGFNGAVYSGEVPCHLGRFFLESGRCTEDDFEELPTDAPYEAPVVEEDGEKVPEAAEIAQTPKRKKANKI